VIFSHEEIFYKAKKRAPGRRRSKGFLVCHICECPIDPSVKRPSSLALSVDHLTPRAKGGGDDDANLLHAHVICNTTKGTRAVDFALKARALQLRNRLWIAEVV